MNYLYPNIILFTLSLNWYHQWQHIMGGNSVDTIDLSPFYYILFWIIVLDDSLLIELEALPQKSPRLHSD